MGDPDLEHAAATRCVLTLTCLDDLVSLDIADNGRGFGPSRPEGTDGRGRAGGPDSTRGSRGPGGPGSPGGPSGAGGPHAGRPGSGYASSGSSTPQTAPVPEQDRTRGHGLPAMRIRARQVGGTLSVESGPGEGTVVTVAVQPASFVPDTVKEPVP